MLSSSLKDVQAEIFTEVFGFSEVASAAIVSGTHEYESTFIDPILQSGAEPAEPRAQSSIRTDIALGTVPTERDTDVRLAVLMQSEDLMGSEALARIRAIAHDEVEVIFIGRQVATWTRTRQRPLRIGSSISPISAGYSGTLGLFARSNASDKIGMVSNNHVLANVNGYPVGTRILQQADGDGGRSSDAVGVLGDYVPILFGGLPNSVDAAFAHLDPQIGYDAVNMFGNGNPPPTIATLKQPGSVPALPGLSVMKTGRTTGHTRGRIRAINVNNYVVNMGANRLARFDGQIIFEAEPGATQAFSRAGDSGSLITDLEGSPIALLFAGSTSGGEGNLGITGGNPISLVLRQLNLSWI